MGSPSRRLTLSLIDESRVTKNDPKKGHFGAFRGAWRGTEKGDWNVRKPLRRKGYRRFGAGEPRRWNRGEKRLFGTQPGPEARASAPRHSRGPEKLLPQRPLATVDTVEPEREPLDHAFHELAQIIHPRDLRGVNLVRFALVVRKVKAGGWMRRRTGWQGGEAEWIEHPRGFVNAASVSFHKQTSVRLRFTDH